MDKTRKSVGVKVIARVRPLLNAEDEAHVYAVDGSTVETFNHRNLKESLQYQFHKVFNEDSKQSDVFDYIRPLLGGLFEGLNACVLAYGPTGAGKTHTMVGSEADPGVILRCVSHIFNRINDHKENKCNCVIKMSFLEIYNEKVQDLLNTKSQDLPIREDGNKQIFVTGLTEKKITSLEDFNEIFNKASQHRTTAATKLNEQSSRSHCVLSIKIERSQADHLLIGKLHLVDLAGSENNKRTGNQGIRLTESGAINKSLHALGQVVDALNHGRLVPYRDSKLTRILQDSLGGNSHTLMIINIAPDQYWETYSTLNFAQKSKRIVNNTYATQMAAKRGTPPTQPVDCQSRENVQVSAQEQRAPPRPFLSPLLRVENTLHDATSRLEALEQALLKQMNQPASSHYVIPTNENLEPSLAAEIKNIKKHLEMMKADKVRETEPPKLIFDSPLVVKKPGMLKRKGFVSSAAPVKSRKLDENMCEVGAEYNSEIQQKHNKDILHILNSGSIQNLQSLQTVGKKRAKLIYDWRQLNGGIIQMTDLEKIPGMTSKWAQTFMKTNLVKT